MDALETNINSFLNGYNGIDTTSYDVLRSVSDTTIYNLEQQFTRNYADVKLTPEQKAQRVIATCRNQPDFLSKSLSISNSYKNADVRTRQFILMMCADDERLTDVLRMAMLDNAGNNPFMAELVADALESTNNEFFRQAIERSNTSDLLRARKEIEAESQPDGTTE